jgi:hypothetical protein
LAKTERLVQLRENWDKMCSLIFDCLSNAVAVVPDAASAASPTVPRDELDRADEEMEVLAEGKSRIGSIGFAVFIYYYLFIFLVVLPFVAIFWSSLTCSTICLQALSRFRLPLALLCRMVLFCRPHHLACATQLIERAPVLARLARRLFRCTCIWKICGIGVRSAKVSVCLLCSLSCATRRFVRYYFHAVDPIFTATLQSTQRAEAENAKIKEKLANKNATLVALFEGLKDLSNIRFGTCVTWLARNCSYLSSCTAQSLRH